MIFRQLISLDQGHHYAEISSVFGLDQSEFECLKQAGLVIKPAKFEKSKDRFQVVKYKCTCLQSNRYSCLQSVHLIILIIFRFTTLHG